MMHDGAVVVHCGVVPTWWLPPTHLAGVALARNLCEIPKRQWGTSAPLRASLHAYMATIMKRSLEQ
jgi:hypothetical protein